MKKDFLLFFRSTFMLTTNQSSSNSLMISGFLPEVHSYGFNGKEKENEHTSGNYDFGARILDTRLGRWLSVDPLNGKSPSLSTYSYGANSPLFFVDPNGEENIVYLIVTDKGKEALLAKGITAESIAKAANSFFKNLGLYTQVKVVSGDPKEFNILSDMDQFDSVAIIGADVTDTKNFIREELDPVCADGELATWTGGADNPERSENNNTVIDKSNPHAGEIIAIDGSAISELTFSEIRLGLTKPKTTKAQAEVMSKVFGLLVLHGLGHNAGLNHAGDMQGPLRGYNSSILMGSANDMKKIKPFGDENFSLFKLGFDEYTSKDRNTQLVDALISRLHANLSTSEESSKK